MPGMRLIDMRCRHRSLRRRTIPARSGQCSGSDRERSSPSNDNSTNKKAPPALEAPKLNDETTASASGKDVLHTHLHIDHAGKDDLFPMNTAVVINRKELEYSVSGLMHPQYPAVDIKHLIDRLHTKGALRLLDLELSGPVELMPGLICEAAGGHTEGSMNVIVKTNEGNATICGDVLYDINDLLVDPFHEISDMEPRVTGNHGNTKRQEKAAIKKVIASSRFVLPVHDRPALIEAGQVVGRLQDVVPGPVVQSLPRRQWFAA